MCIRDSLRVGATTAPRGRTSKLVRVSQRWRSDVPMQSVPVSPPPITITFLPAASMKLPSYLRAEGRVCPSEA
eukprot:4998751-Prymnesium_polylepis.1